MTTTNDELVCGLIDPTLVRKVVGDGEIGTRGPGIRSAKQRAAEPANCTVQDQDRNLTVLQVSVGEVDAAAWATKLDAEARADRQCTTRYDGDPGQGYGCLYDRGTYVDGAGVNVVRGDRLIRVVVYHWASATPDERLQLAEDVVLDVDRNVGDYDRTH